MDNRIDDFYGIGLQVKCDDGILAGCSMRLHPQPILTRRSDVNIFGGEREPQRNTHNNVHIRQNYATQVELRSTLSGERDYSKECNAMHRCVEQKYLHRAISA